MHNKTWAMTAIAAVLASGLAVGSALSQQLVVEQQQGSVTYATGGITMEEAEAFKAAAGRYSLSLELAKAAQPRAEYLSGVAVRISDAAGRQYLDIVSDGPFVLAQLPPGQYQIRAESGGVVRTQTVQIGAGRRHVVMTW